MDSRLIQCGYGLLFCLMVTTSVMPALADDWLQWRGSDLTSISQETGLPVEFGRQQNLRWRIPLPGSTGSSPVVAGDNVFVTSVDGDQLKLICVSTVGKLKWERAFPGANRNSRDSANSASASPMTDGQHVWAMMGNGQLACYTVDGEKVWGVDLQEKYGKFDIQFGMSSTPLLDNGRLYLQLMHGDMRDQVTTSNGQVICLDAATGEQVWLHERKTDGTAENKHSYASPTIYRDQNREFLVTHGADYVIAHSLDDGSELWRCGGFNPKSNYNPYLRLVASPVCGDGLVVAPTAKQGPVLAIKADSQGNVTGQDEALRWKADRVTPDVATPVIYQDLVYLAGERGVLTCLDIKTGQQHYRERMMSDKHRSTPVAADGKIYLADRNGTIVVLAAGKEYKELARNEIGEETTASPAISNGCVYIRTFEALYCFGKNE